MSKEVMVLFKKNGKEYFYEMPRNIVGYSIPRSKSVIDLRKVKTLHLYHRAARNYLPEQYPDDVVIVGDFNFGKDFVFEIGVGVVTSRIKFLDSTDTSKFLPANFQKKD